MNTLRKHPVVRGTLVLGNVLLLLVAFFMPSAAAVTPIDFTGFTGTGFTPTPGAGQLDSDYWATTGFGDNVAFGGTCTSGDCARGSSNGGVTTGGIYAFDVDSGGSGNVILGVQPGGDDFTPGDIKLKVQNTTGSTIADLYVSYKIWVYNDQDRANSLNFSYSKDDSNYTPVGSLDYTTPGTKDAPLAWSSTDRSTTITGINLANNDYVYLKWTGNDVSGSNYRDEYGIDDIEVRVGGPTAVTLASLTANSAAPWAGLALAGLLVGGLVFVRRKK